MNYDQLRQEIAFGLDNLENVHQEIVRFATLEIDEKVKASALTYECLGYYNAIEHLVVRFLKYRTYEIPSGAFSHRDTLHAFNRLLGEISLSDAEVLLIIERLMAFRHVATKIYGFLINGDKLGVIVEDIQANHERIKALFTQVLSGIN